MRLNRTNRLLTALALTALLGFGMAIPAVHAQNGDPVAGEKLFGGCKACHKIGEGAKNAFGPVLNSIVDRPAGSFPGFKYSKSVREANGKDLVWTEENLFNWLAGPTDFLRAYLDNPKAKAKMPFKLKDAQKRRDIIAFLKTLSVKEAMGGKKSQTMTHGNAPTDANKGTADTGKPDPLAGLQRTKLELVAPPFAPKHDQIAQGGPKIVEVLLTPVEKKWVVDSDGTEFYALTFNGSIPAPLIVVHQDDYVELTLQNASHNTMEHNIDLHAVSGALGGAALTTVAPGEEAKIRFKATKAGVFLYHCAPEGIMTPYHVTHGMTGAILVLPRDGLKDDKGNPLAYDKIFYVGENDFYLPRDENGAFKKYSAPGEDLQDWAEEMRGLTPSHIVFNGRVGALTGKGSLQANVGDRVLFLHVQGNRDTRPHLIGGHGDFVWETGTFESPPLKNVQTWFIRGGSAGAMWYQFPQPGIYVYLNHNLIEAVQLGAAAHVVVKGEWNDDLLQQLYHRPLK